VSAIGAIGYHWQQTQPQQAITVLAFAAANSEQPEYPAWLALLLADTDEAAAHASLQRAEQLADEAPDTPEWLQSLLDSVRQRLGRPQRAR